MLYQEVTDSTMCPQRRSWVVARVVTWFIFGVRERAGKSLVVIVVSIVRSQKK